MENASKALIIAGAILLAILIIGLGVFIYNQAANTVNDTGMDQLAVRQFNAQFEPYIMERASGATAMALYDTVRTYNSTVSDDKKVTLNLIRYGVINQKAVVYTESDEVEVVKLAARAEAAEIEHRIGITFEKSRLSSLKRYNIYVNRYDGGVIKEINIEPVSNSSGKEFARDDMMAK